MLECTNTTISRVVERFVFRAELRLAESWRVLHKLLDGVGTYRVWHFVTFQLFCDIPSPRLLHKCTHKTTGGAVDGFFLGAALQPRQVWEFWVSYLATSWDRALSGIL